MKKVLILFLVTQYGLSGYIKAADNGSEGFKLYLSGQQIQQIPEDLDLPQWHQFYLSNKQIQPTPENKRLIAHLCLNMQSSKAAQRTTLAEQQYACRVAEQAARDLAAQQASCRVAERVYKQIYQREQRAAKKEAALAVERDALAAERAALAAERAALAAERDAK